MATTTKKPSHPPTREEIPSLESLGVSLHPDTLMYVDDSQALANAIGGNGLKDVFANWIVFAAAFSASMGGLLFGFDQGILSVVYTMPIFLNDFPDVDSAQSSAAGLNKGGIMTGLLELGAFLGAMQAGFLADKYSRKRTIGIGAIWFIVGSVLQAASQNYAMLVVGRFIGGVGIGLLSSTAPMYISEIAPPNVRGALLALEGSTIVIGIVIMFYITYGTRHIANEWCYRLPFTVQMLPVFLLGAGMWFLPYSPRWLAQVGRDAEALESLVRLRGFPASDPRIQAEWITIRGDALRSREVVVLAHPAHQSGSFKDELKLEMHSWLDMFKPGILPRTMIGVILMFFQQFQGINALIYYSPTLFGTLGLDLEMQLTMSGVLNILQMVATCSAFFLLDKTGRKPPLLLGSLANTICHSVTAAMIGRYSYDWNTHAAQAWVGVGFILAFMFFFGLGWSPVPWALPSEVQSTSRRAKGVACSVMSNWFFNFIIGLITPPMIESIGYGTFIFFASFSLLSLFYVWFFVPETKGKTLEELDDIFKDRSAHEEVVAKNDIIRLMLGGGQHGSVENVDDKSAGEDWVERK